MKRPVTKQLPAPRVPRDQLWFQHPEMQRRIRMAEADLAAGRSTVTHSAEEARAVLDSFKGKQRRGNR